MKEVKLNKKEVKEAARIWAASTLRNCALETLRDVFSDTDADAITEEISHLANKLSPENVFSIHDLHNIYYTNAPNKIPSL